MPYHQVRISALKHGAMGPESRLWNRYWWLQKDITLILSFIVAFTSFDLVSRNPMLCNTYSHVWLFADGSTGWREVAYQWFQIRHSKDLLCQLQDMSRFQKHLRIGQDGICHIVQMSINKQINGTGVGWQGWHCTSHAHFNGVERHDKVKPSHIIFDRNIVTWFGEMGLDDSNDQEQWEGAMITKQKK